MRLKDLVTPEEFKQELFRETTPEDEAEADERMKEMMPYADVLIDINDPQGPHRGSVMMALQIIDNVLRRKVVQ